MSWDHGQYVRFREGEDNKAGPDNRLSQQTKGRIDDGFVINAVDAAQELLGAMFDEYIMNPQTLQFKPADAGIGQGFQYRAAESAFPGIFLNRQDMGNS